MPSDRVFDELPEQPEVATCSRQLEVAEADEAGRDTAHDGAGLRSGVTVVEHVAHDGVAGERQAEGTRVVGTPR